MVAMQELFPELTDLVLISDTTMIPPLPDSFLGGSAPRLRNLLLVRVPFPGLPKLLLSATHLVNIRLYGVPHSGFFFPEALVTALSSSTSLRLLALGLRSSPKLASRHPPPTRSLLPVLDTLTFKGPSEYLDDLVARIDAPRLNIVEIDFFKGVLDTPQFTQFIRRTPMFQAHEKAYVAFLRLEGAAVGLSSQTSGCGVLKVNII